MSFLHQSSLFTLSIISYYTLTWSLSWSLSISQDIVKWGEEHSPNLSLKSESKRKKKLKKIPLKTQHTNSRQTLMLRVPWQSNHKISKRLYSPDLEIGSNTLAYVFREAPQALAGVDVWARWSRFWYSNCFFSYPVSSFPTIVLPLAPDQGAC